MRIGQELGMGKPDAKFLGVVCKSKGEGRFRGDSD